MNIEKYLETNNDKIDMSILVDLFFQESKFYTLILPQKMPLNNEYLSQDFDGKMLGLIFTSTKKLEKYKKSEKMLSNWIIKEYKTEEFENYFNECNRKLDGIIINYGDYWAKLFLN